MSKTTIQVHIRWMIRRDMTEVLSIEQRSHRKNQKHLAWTEDDFLKQLRQRNVIGMVAEVNERIVGYMIYELHTGKLHVTKLAVDPKLWRFGIGTQMVEKLKGKLSSHRRTAITFAEPHRNRGKKFLLACGCMITQAKVSFENMLASKVVSSFVAEFNLNPVSIYDDCVFVDVDDCDC